MTTINVVFGDMLYVVHWCDDIKRGVRGYVVLSSETVEYINYVA